MVYKDKKMRPCERVKLLFGFAVILAPLLPAASSLNIAIIGGGISGTFAAKYLADYDKSCSLESITIIDPFPIGELFTVDRDRAADDKNVGHQGSRIASAKLLSGKNQDQTAIVELGASSFSKDFRFLGDMINGDPSLEMEADTATIGVLLYEGNTERRFTTISNAPSLWERLCHLYIYNIDLWRLSSAMQKYQFSLRLIHKWLDNTHASTFFESAVDMWVAAGLQKPTMMSFEELLDALGIPEELSWWRSFLPYQRSLRADLLNGLSFSAPYQALSRQNGLAGLASSTMSHNDLVHVKGGNTRLIQSALMQARNTRKSQCGDTNVIQHVQRRVVTLVGDLDGIELFDSSFKSLGDFDAVILATPMQLSGISFLVRSDKDGSVLHDMPLGGLVVPEDVASHDGHAVLPPQPPPMATLPYTQVIVTIVSNADLQRDLFPGSCKQLPDTIVFTKVGPWTEGNVTTITRLEADDVYRVTSNVRLDESTLQMFFGPHVVVEYVKLWGGTTGGATPDYQGEGKSMSYLLFDSGAGLEEGTIGAALYYPNAIEASITGLGASSIGAKSVAKLASKRLGLLKTSDKADHGSSEL